VKVVNMLKPTVRHVTEIVPQNIIPTIPATTSPHPTPDVSS
jgi:hypothetical protein